MIVSIYRSLFYAMIAGFIIFSGNAFAEQTVIFSVGEWEPFVGETMVNYGPTAEIMATACKKAGYKAQFEFYPWKRAYKNVKTGKAVATFPWARTEERAIEVLFPETPLMISKEKFFYLKEKFPIGLTINKFEDLKSYKMVGTLGYWYEEPAKKAGVSIHMVSSADLAWNVLGKGRADVLLENELVAKADLEKIFGDSANRFASTKEPFKTADMFCLFSRVHPDSIEIMKKLDQALKEMSAAGEIERILMK